MKRILVIAPHPDDETLGCGGTILKHINEGHKVDWLIATTNKDSLNINNEEIVKREKEIEKVIKDEIVHANIQCEEEISIQLRNHDKSNKTFEIYMLNSVPIAGFQCDFQGINILSSDGGLLIENEYQTSNSVSRILSYSMKSQLIPIGEGILTKIIYTEPNGEICMTDIIFAGLGGKQLSNNKPECIIFN